MGRHLQRGEAEEGIRLLHARGDVGQLYERLEIEQAAKNLSLIAKTRIFISYSHEDREWLEMLRRHLAPLVHERDVDIFVDTEILPGRDWKGEIESAIESARVAILLISANFLASKFIREIDLPTFFRAVRESGMIVLPLHVSSSLVQNASPLWAIQAMNDPAMPIDTLPDGEQQRVFRDAALKDAGLVKRSADRLPSP